MSVAFVFCLSSTFAEFSVEIAFLYPVVEFSLPETMVGTSGSVQFWLWRDWHHRGHRGHRGHREKGRGRQLRVSASG